MGNLTEQIKRARARQKVEQRRRFNGQIVKRILPDSAHAPLFRADVPTSGAGIEIIKGAIKGCRIILAGTGRDDFEIVTGEHSITERDTGRIHTEQFDRLIVKWDENPGTTELVVRIYHGGRPPVPVDVGQGRGNRGRMLTRGQVVIAGNTYADFYSNELGNQGVPPVPWENDCERDVAGARLAGFVRSETSGADFDVVLSASIDDSTFVGVYRWQSKPRIPDTSYQASSGLPAGGWELITFGYCGASSDEVSITQGSAVLTPFGFWRIGIGNKTASPGTFDYLLGTID